MPRLKSTHETNLQTTGMAIGHWETRMITGILQPLQPPPYIQPPGFICYKVAGKCKLHSLMALLHISAEQGKWRYPIHRAMIGSLEHVSQQRTALRARLSCPGSAMPAYAAKHGSNFVPQHLQVLDDTSQRRGHSPISGSQSVAMTTFWSCSVARNIRH